MMTKKEYENGCVYVGQLVGDTRDGFGTLTCDNLDYSYRGN